MSQTTIANKAAEIGNETQQFGNTRTRVRAVLDDINETKANKEDVEAEFATIQAGQEAQDSLIQDGVVKNNEQDTRLDALEQKDLNLEEQITNINATITDVNDKKISKPLDSQPNGTYMNAKVGSAVSQVAVSQGGSQGILYFNGTNFQGTQINYSLSLNTVGFNGAPPSDSNLKVAVWGGISADRYVIKQTSFQPIAGALRWDGTSLYFSTSTSTEQKVAFGTDIPKFLPSIELVSYTQDATNYYIKYRIINLVPSGTPQFYNTGLNNSNTKLYLNGTAITSYSVIRIAGTGTIIPASLETNGKPILNIMALMTIPKADNTSSLWTDENGVISVLYNNNPFAGDNLPLFASTSFMGNQIT